MDAALASGRVGDLTIVIPNDCENGHDACGTRDRVRPFDAFLEVPKIEASPSFTPTTTIFVRWDERADKPLDSGNPLLVAFGGAVRPGVVATGSYTHYSLLRTIEARLGPAYLRGARSARGLPVYRSPP